MGIEREVNTTYYSDGRIVKKKRADRYLIQFMNGTIRVIDLWRDRSVKLVKAWTRDKEGYPVQLGYRAYVK